MKLKSHNYNKYLQDLSFYFRSSFAINKPKIFQVEVTNNCNLACIMCPYTEQTRKKGSMGLEVFKTIVDNGWLADSDFVRLHGMGEPLMNKKVFDLVEYASNKDINTEISTNICLLNKVKAQKVIDSKLTQIILSLDGMTKDTYEHIRAKADFEKSVKNLNDFLDLKKKSKSNIYTVVQIIFMKETADEVLDFVNHWKTHGALDEIRIRFYSSWAMQEEHINEQYESFVDDNISVKRKNPCRLLWESVSVQFDGKVVPCCRDFDSKYVLGDLNDNSLQEIWNGKKLKNLRKEHLDNNYDNILCKNCNEYDAINPSIGILIKKLFRRLFPKNNVVVPEVQNIMYKQLIEKLGRTLDSSQFHVSTNEVKVFLK